MAARELHHAARRGGRAIAIAALIAGCGRVEVDPDARQGDPNDPCAPPYRTVMGSCYRVAISFATWPAAEADCESDGAHLATIIDVSEHSALHGLSTDAQVSEIWIGYADRATEGTFRWVSPGGLDPSTDMCFFGPGGAVNSDAEDCVVQRSQTACGDWFVRDCMLERPYICERDGNPAAAR